MNTKTSLYLEVKQRSGQGNGKSRNSEDTPIKMSFT